MDSQKQQEKVRFCQRLSGIAKDSQKWTRSTDIFRCSQRQSEMVGIGCRLLDKIRNSQGTPENVRDSQGQPQINRFGHIIKDSKKIKIQPEMVKNSHRLKKIQINRNRFRYQIRIDLYRQKSIQIVRNRIRQLEIASFRS